MDKNYLEELILKRYDINIIKEVLVINTKSLENRSEDWRENWHVLVLVSKLLVIWIKQRQFKLQNGDKLRAHLKHLVYYTLSWIACIDN